MNIKDLPEIVLERGFASQLGVAPNGLLRMVVEGTLPKPFARRGKTPVWSNDDIVKFFSKLHPEQSAYAPITETGLAELDELGAYICPATSSGHIGNRRPAHLALYEAGGERGPDGMYAVKVYKVQWVQTQSGVSGETLAALENVAPSTFVPVPWEQVRAGHDSGPLTLFKLDQSSEPRTLSLRQGIQRGGTISTATLLEALDSPLGASHFQGGIVHLAR